MQKTTFVFFVFFCVVVMVIGYLWAGAYTDSIHGNTTYGVNRTSLSSFGYPIGNCTHCHEQHTSIGGQEPAPVSGNPDKWLLMSSVFTNQSTCFCYECHKDVTSSYQTGMPNQYCYSYRWGGDTGITCPDNIREAFMFIDVNGASQSNCGSTTGSAHYLVTIQGFLKNKWGFGSTKSNIHPCTGCHNPHRVKRASYPVGSQGTSPISRPTSHASQWELWGDDITERMSNYTSNYQAPYYYGSTTTYEPYGNSTNDGSNMPDYVTFCTDCHNTSYDGQVSSNEKYTFTGDWQALLYNPDWENVSPHGKIDGSKPDSMKRKAPYTSNRNYVLSCTDCHEPHGSPNGMLIRKEVNGSNAVAFTAWASRSAWLTLCQRCHNISSGHSGSHSCYTCHMHNKNWFKPI